MSRVDDELLKVSALCAHTPSQQHEALLRQLVAHWTRQLNLHAKGKATHFTPLEIDEIISFLETLILESRHDRPNP